MQLLLQHVHVVQLLSQQVVVSHVRLQQFVIFVALLLQLSNQLVLVVLHRRQCLHLIVQVVYQRF